MEIIETILNETFKENESMIVPLKFLNIGIRHLKKNEKNVLFQFTKEERNTFKKFVLDKLDFSKIRKIMMEVRTTEDILNTKNLLEDYLKEKIF